MHMKSTKTILASSAVIIAFALIVAPFALSDDALAKKSNNGIQTIHQGQVNEQNGQCVSGDVTIISCNNVAPQLQFNKGKLSLGQQ